MLKRAIRHSRPLLHTSKSTFGLFNALLHFMRTALNRIRWEENQQFTALDKRASTVPKNSEQATQLFMATEQQVALSERGRLQRIDDILGTKTYFHEGKVYQERVDSDHLMEIEQLKKENPQTSREHLNWLNPQADVKIRYKNKRNYYRLVSQLSTYPSHQPGNYNLADEVDEKTIAFLAQETAFTTISLKPIELTAKSLEQEALLLPPESAFESQRYCYFRPQYTMQLLRVPKTLYSSSLLSDPNAIAALRSQVEEVISLDEIYEALKQYDTDERVHEYLRKVENNRIEYLFSDISFDSTEDLIGVTIDILDNGKEHCLLVKSLASKQTTIKPIFNLKPPVVFSADSKQLLYIQRSGQGGWVELVKRPVDSCWSQSGIISSEEDEGIIYRASPEKQLTLGKDTNLNYIFLTIRDYGKPFSESLMTVGLKDGNLYIYNVDQDKHCQYFYDMSPIGLIFGRKRKVESGDLKYGNTPFYIESVQLVPFKQHIQIHTEKIGLTELLEGSTSKPAPPGPEQLDFLKKKCIFMPQQHQYITQLEVRNSHLVMILNFGSVYDRAILYLLPLKGSARPHSLILKGGNLRLKSNTYTYHTQQVQFFQSVGPLFFEKVYNIWKRELKESQREASRYHHQILQVNDYPYPFELHFLCKSIYLQETELPIVLFLVGRGEEVDQQVLRQFLEKGVGVVQFSGRGTFHKDLGHFLSGSRQNFGNMLDDLKAAIQFIGNNMTSNISLYCKGNVSSLAGLWFNIYFPYLFNASILHNGVYDLSDAEVLASCSDFFGRVHDQDIKSFDFKKFNPFEHKFKTLSRSEDSEDEKKTITIGYLQNIIISSEKDHRTQSRKLIKRLRQNKLLRYDSVYLREYEDSYSTDLHNLSFLYANIRDRLERQLNQPLQQDSQDN